MKFVALKSVGHSIADSLASGICLLIGYYEIDIFVEAAGSSAGYIEVDFLTGATAGSPASSGLLRAVDLFREVVPEQCKKQGAEYSRLAKLTVRFGTDAVYAPSLYGESGRYRRAQVNSAIRRATRQETQARAQLVCVTAFTLCDSLLPKAVSLHNPPSHQKH